MSNSVKLAAFTLAACAVLPAQIVVAEAPGEMVMSSISVEEGSTSSSQGLLVPILLLLLVAIAVASDSGGSMSY